jgi:hypothetical protein
MATKQAINDLHFMAAVIRRSSVQNEKYNLITGFETNEELLFGQFARLLVKRDFPNARHSLCEQLAASIAVRRKMLSHRKLHEDKLGERRQVTPVGPQLTVSPSEQSQARPNPLPLQRLKNQKDRPTGSDDTRSRFDGQAARGYLQAGPSLSTISRGSSVRNRDILYPDMPEISSANGRCTCPYCGKPLVAKKLKEDLNYWK